MIGVRGSRSGAAVSAAQDENAVRVWSALARVVPIQHRRARLPGLCRRAVACRRTPNGPAILLVIDLPAIRLKAAFHEADPKTKPRVPSDEKRGCRRRMPGRAVQRHRSAKLQVGRSLLSTFCDHVEGDFLAVVQGADPCRLQSSDVHEHVLAAVLRLNEAEALVAVEPLHCSSCHVDCLWLGRIRNVDEARLGCQPH